MKEETKGTQAERCKRTMHQLTINQKELKSGRPTGLSTEFPKN
jgi:hypothetical protein